ncbi:CPBP family intramembrane glutamic endopeptidase [Sphingomonas soli]|uniref:CPBP family intramembrane glutamic endopeptidase n=1 Tax=Sphingomonas soli TaxID=266127 RepID=UPI00082B73C2|nr:CPBP family intramembrane glutamic endopeptidase [Sphingomonas soli]
MHIGWRQRLGALAQILLVLAALFVSAAILGAAAAPLPPAYSTPAMALGMWGAVGAGALLLRRSGQGYVALGLRAPASWRATLGWAALGLAISWLGALAIGAVIRIHTGWPPLDLAYIRGAIQGDTLAWIVWLALVVWGSAAFGEELLSRGFVLDRLRIACGGGRVALGLAMLLQAALFGWLHALQGPTGIVLTAWAGLVFAGIWLASGRNLWAPILAHGATDTISLTLIYAGVPFPGYIN